MRSAVQKIPKEKLAVSEPNPAWFGNGPNENKPNWNNKNWLKSRFHFSFAEYSNPKNTNFGVLRVMNDDLVQPRRGFGEHGHRDAEICTYIIDGHLTHKDSMGTAETLGRGAVQFMTAGRGVRHSEFNLGDKPLRFIQMWMTPRARGLKPNYGSATTTPADRANKWFHLVGDANDKSTQPPVRINCDANIFVSEIAKNHSVKLSVRAGRQAYCLVLEGQTQVSQLPPPLPPATSVSAKATSSAAVVGADSSTAKPADASTNPSPSTDPNPTPTTDPTPTPSTDPKPTTAKAAATTCPSPPTVALTQHDAAEIVGPADLTLSTKSDAHVLIVEMKWDSHADGRSDM